jgi:hypothetical protein
MFYKTGVDITNDKQMFNFLKNHFEYHTMNSWNRGSSIANKVKLHSLNLSGDWCTALALLENGEYDTINWMIQDWCREHNGYEVYFNGRSGGYLVLKEDDTSCGALPSFITECDDYEEYKRYCREEYCGSVKANRSDLVFYTKLVQDFDKLCDELRDFCDRLSNLKFEVIEMEKSVERFNDGYIDDLELLGFDPLTCDGNGNVDVSEICTLTCLYEAFLRIADRSDSGYLLSRDGDYIKYVER